MGDRRGTELNGSEDGEELVGIQGGEIIIRIYYMKKKRNVFSRNKIERVSLGI